MFFHMLKFPSLHTSPSLFSVYWLRAWSQEPDCLSLNPSFDSLEYDTLVVTPSKTTVSSSVEWG